MALISQKRGGQVVLAALISLIAAACNPHSRPRADAGAALSLQAGEIGFLIGNATDPDGDAIVSWSWAVDSSPAGSTPLLDDPTSQVTGFVTDTEGDYVVSLVASDSRDSSRPDVVAVSVAANPPPVAVITADVTTGIAPLTVSLDSAGSSDSGGGALAFIWSFADGTPIETTPSVTHTFDSPDAYLVELLVVDDTGQVTTASVLITVEASSLPVPALGAWGIVGASVALLIALLHGAARRSNSSSTH